MPFESLSLPSRGRMSKRTLACDVQDVQREITYGT